MKVNVIGVPLFYGCDKKGVDKGPDILRENVLIDILSNHNKNQVYDLGNLYVKSVSEEDKYSNHDKMKYLSPITEVNTNLAHSVFSSLMADCFPFVVGGDHSLGLGSLAGASKYFGDDFGVIWIDAHGDINTHTTSPTGNIHGMPLGASIGIGHNALTDLYFQGKKVDSSKIFIFCARDLDEGEIKLIEELNLSVWTTSRIKKEGIGKTLEEFYNKIHNINNFHLSFDIDCIDCSYVPGTGTPVDEGLELNEVKELLKGILETKKIKSMDFVEFNPVIDDTDTTLNTCLDLLNTIAQNL